MISCTFAQHMPSRGARRLAATMGLLIASVGGATPAVAQAFNYPSLQTPRISSRDYTAAIAGGSGTSALFQWREGAGRDMHLGLDAGVADLEGSENLILFFGGSLAKSLLRSNGEQPLDLLLTAGIGAGFGGGTTIFRLPVGASVGHQFDLEDGMSLTPYVHPRLSVDICDDCGRGGGNRSEVSLSFDLGLNFQVNRQFAIRGSATFSGSDYFGDDAFALGLNWTPSALSRSRQSR